MSRGEVVVLHSAAIQSRLPVVSTVGLALASTANVDGDLSMSLKEKLEATRALSESRVPAETRAIMERATADLRASGSLRRVAAVGQMAPAFVAPNYDGRTISSKELLAGGPLVLSFFRGAW